MEKKKKYSFCIIPLNRCSAKGAELGRVAEEPWSVQVPPACSQPRDAVEKQDASLQPDTPSRCTAIGNPN